MVVDHYDTQRRVGYLLLQPNQAESWRRNKQILLAFAFLSLSIATFFMLLGAWVIFPFAGLEIIVLMACFYVSAKKQAQKEIIIIEENTIRVQRGRYAPRQDIVFERSWVNVTLQSAVGRMGRLRVLLAAQATVIEVGASLNDRDKRILYRTLQSVQAVHQHL